MKRACFALLLGFGLIIGTPPSALASPQVGLLDRSFGRDGRITTGFGVGTSSSVDGANAIVVQPDGRIVAVGYRIDGGSRAFALARYSTNGALDPAFGVDGRVTTTFASGAIADAAVLQPDGKIVVAGSAWVALRAAWDVALARYDPDGTLDTSFSADGRVRIQVGTADAHAYGVALQPDGKIVVAGSAEATRTDMALARFDPDGSLDPSFGAGGIATTAFADANAVARGVAVQLDGKIVVAGFRDNYGAFAFALARYDTSGVLDPSFSGNGKLTTWFGEGTGCYANETGANALVIQPDGKIVAAGHTHSPCRSEFALARYEIDGSLDASFGNHGHVATVLNGDFDSVNANGVALQSDGKLVVAGSAWVGYPDPGNWAFAIFRYNPDGSLDQRFSGDGKILTLFGAVYRYQLATSVAIQPDGKIVAAGRAPTNRGDFAVARYSVPAYRPDARIAGYPGYYYGDDIYTSTGGRQIFENSSLHRTSFWIRMENDGSATDTFAVKGCGSTSGFIVTYSADRPS